MVVAGHGLCDLPLLRTGNLGTLLTLAVGALDGGTGSLLIWLPSKTPPVVYGSVLSSRGGVKGVITNRHGCLAVSGVGFLSRPPG